MDSRSLTVVLPAYNEEHRLEPALDELFGYLRRRADRGREGAPGGGDLFRTPLIRRSVQRRPTRQ